MKVINIISEDDNGYIVSLNMDYYELCCMEKIQGFFTSGWCFNINIIMTEDKIFNFTYKEEQKRDEMFSKIQELFKNETI